jgi:uncharacterized RDD family membrane protein YckC
MTKAPPFAAKMTDAVVENTDGTTVTDPGADGSHADEPGVAPRGSDRHGALWSVFAAACRLMIEPVRVVAGPTGIDVSRRLEEAAVDAVATPATERALDELCAGPLPEMIGRALGEHRVLERIIAEAVARDDVEQSLASALVSERTSTLLRESLDSPAVQRVLASPEFERTLGSVFASPQVRRAFAQQSTTFAGELAAAARARAVDVDAAAERGPRRWLRRAPRALSDRGRYGGIATRGLAFAADAALVATVLLLGGALVGLVASLFGELRPVWLVGVLAGAAALIVEIVYFAGFWSTIGQTPGMRLMRLRVLTAAGVPPGFWRSVVRLVGLAVAVVPCFAGFLPVLVDDRRRALPDFVAGTVVVYTGDGTLD